MVAMKMSRHKSITGDRQSSQKAKIILQICHCLLWKPCWLRLATRTLFVSFANGHFFFFCFFFFFFFFTHSTNQYRWRDARPLTHICVKNSISDDILRTARRGDCQLERVRFIDIEFGGNSARERCVCTTDALATTHVESGSLCLLHRHWRRAGGDELGRCLIFASCGSTTALCSSSAPTT
jgi:hypothetical protein